MDTLTSTNADTDTHRDKHIERQMHTQTHIHNAQTQTHSKPFIAVGAADFNG